MDKFVNAIKTHFGLIVLTLSLLGIFLLFWLFRNILLPFFIGLILAYMLLPVVSWLEKHLPGKKKWHTARRVTAIIITYIVGLAIIGTASYYTVSSIIGSYDQIANNIGQYTSNAIQTVQDFFTNLFNALPGTGEQPSLSSFSQNFGSILQNFLANITSAIPSSFNYIAGFASLPIFLFYLLKDHEYFNDKLFSWLPENGERHLRNVMGIVKDVLGGYLRAQLMMGLVVGVMALIGLEILGIPLAPGLALVNGIAELIPILGPWIGGAVGVLVVLATDPDKILWVLIMYVGIQLVENTFLTPKMHGKYMHVHPVAAILLIVIGSAVAGFWGLILAVPLASTIVRLYQYVLASAREEDSREAQIQLSGKQE